MGFAFVCAGTSRKNNTRAKNTIPARLKRLGREGLTPVVPYKRMSKDMKSKE
jgi:hypothetical protein